MTLEPSRLDGEGTASKLDRCNLAWVAGIVEGEGTFGWTATKTNTYQAKVRVQMTDEDIIRRLRAVTGVGNVGGPYESRSQNGHYKKNGEPYAPAWYWQVSKMADAIGLMMTLYPFLGERRRAKVREIIEQWKVYAPDPRYSKLERRRVA